MDKHNQNQNGIPMDIQIPVLCASNPEWFERHLLVRCLHDPIFWKQNGRAIGWLQLPDRQVEIRRLQTPAHEALYHAWWNYRQLPGSDQSHERHQFDTMVALLRQMCQEGRHVSQYEMPEVVTLLREIQRDKAALPHARNVTQQYFIEWITNSSARHLHSLLQSGVMSATEAHQGASHELKYLREDHVQEKMFGFGHGIDNPLPYVPRVPTGITELDMALGGGLGAGEAHLILGCTGVGKSALCCQVAGAQATQVRGRPNPQDPEGRGTARVLYVTTEASQKHHQLEPRFISNLAQIPYGVLVDGVRPEILTERQRADYERVREVLSGANLMFYEWDRQDPRGQQNPLAYLDDIIKEAQDRMNGLDGIMLDWIGGALPPGVTDLKRHHYQELGNGFCSLVGNYGLAGIAFAQAHASFRNKREVDDRAITECKSLGQEFTSMIGITAFIRSRDEMSESKSSDIFRDEQLLWIGKSRKGMAGAIPIRRNLAYQRFESSHGAGSGHVRHQPMGATF